MIPVATPRRQQIGEFEAGKLGYTSTRAVSRTSFKFCVLDITGNIGSYISGTDDEIDAALIRLRALRCQPIPLDGALSALGACLGQAFRDRDAEVDYRSKLILERP